MPIPAGDLTLLRDNPQVSRLYLVIQQSQYSTDDGATWTGYDWSCRINGAHSDDPTVTLTVDGGAAATDLLDGMTILIGSSKYGDWDKGIYYVRGDQTVDGATVALDISTSSEVRDNVADDDYVVVLDEFRSRQRYGRIEIVAEEPVWYKDYDIEWGDIGATDAGRRLAMMPPVPIMGPHAVKFVEIGGNSAQFYFDWQDSYAPAVGETVDTWTSEGEADHAGGTWNSAVQTPGWQTVDAISGLRGFRVTLEVDDGNGNATTLPYRRGVRYVFTLRRPGETQDGDPDNAEPITEFELAEPVSGSSDEGYWRTSITVFESEASKYNIMPGALVILFTEDTYGTTAGSLGPITDRENILMVGHIVDGTIRKNPETGDVTFDVASPGAELVLRHNYPIVIQHTDASESWIGTPSLTVDRAVHYYVTWHTTLHLIADRYDIGDSVEIYAMDFMQGDIYSTLNQFMHDRLFARLLCDKYGRFHCEIDANDRAFGSTTTQWTMATADWLDEVTVRHRLPAPFNASECGGIIYEGGLITPKLAHAPGLFDKYSGAREANTSLAIEDQATLNTICGRHLNALNHEYEIDFSLAGNWRYCDIAPQRVVDIGTLETDREDLTGTYIIRAVVNEYDPDAGVIFTSIQTHQEAVDGVAAATIDIPETLPSRTPIRVPRLPVYPGIGPIGPPAEDFGRRIISTNVGVFYTDNFLSASPVWIDCNAGLPNDATRRCWKIFRDPWHWWTSEGSERTLWGVFSDPADIITQEQPRYIYKMENFPYGTWVESLDAADITINPNPTFQNWVEDLVPTIEVQDKLYTVIHHHTQGLDAGYAYLVTTTDGGATWVENLAVTINPLIVNGSLDWPERIPYRMDTAKHSGASTIYVSQLGGTGSGFEWQLQRTVNAGGVWATYSSIAWGALTGQGIRGSRIQIPYKDASWNDSVAYHRIVHPAAGAGLGAPWLRRSTDYGATFATIGQSPVAAGYAYRAGAAFGDRIYATLHGNTTTTNLDYTVDGGSAWTTLRTMAYPVGYAALFAYTSGGTVENVLLSDTTPAAFGVRLVSSVSDLDKTGNLLTVAAGIDAITTFERDTMGSA